MLDWMLATRRRVGIDRTAQDRSYSAASQDWTRRPAAGHIRACTLEDVTATRRPASLPMDWNTGWRRTVRDFGRDR
jgi:hypothetical protein